MPSYSPAWLTIPRRRPSTFWRLIRWVSQVLRDLTRKNDAQDDL
jgi:hypothetical protein